jgi:adenosylcobinamide-GDP ribazoletransferase
MLRSLALALSFLTRIPVRTGEVAPAESAASLPSFPIVGALIGALLWALQLLLTPLFGAWLSALVLVAASALITGALHLDGVADLCDGLGGGRGDRNRVLDIMRDPRVGAHGAAGLVIVITGKLLATHELIGRGSAPSWTWAIALAPLWARFTCVLAIKAFPYARPSGLGLAFHVHARTRHVVLAAVPSALAIALTVRAGATPALLASALLASAVLSLSLARRVHHLLGGITGDVHGACIELCELVVLFAACARNPPF